MFNLTLKDWIIVIILIPILWMTLNLISFLIYKIILNKAESNKNYAAILVGYTHFYDRWLWMSIHILLAIRYYKKNRLKIKLYKQAKEDDLKFILQDKFCKSMTIMGHGKEDYWCDSKDNKVYCKNYLQYKIQQVIQLSCTNKDFINFTALANNKNISYCKKGHTNPILNFVFLIKAILLKRFSLD